jgi:hypothetical protein
VRPPNESPNTGTPSQLGQNGYFVRPGVLFNAAEALTGEPKTLSDTKADVTANPLTADAFGKLSESAKAADVHKQVVSKLDELLTGASKGLQDLVDELYARSRGYKWRDEQLHDEQIKLGTSRG